MGLVNITKSFEFCFSFKILQITFKCVRPSEIPAKNILNFKMKQISFEKQIKNRSHAPLRVLKEVQT